MQVKWCWDYEVKGCGSYPTTPPYTGHNKPVEIVELAALAEVVDFLKEILENAVICTDYEHGHYKCVHCSQVNKPDGEFTHLDDCETHTARGLLAQLAPQKEGEHE